MTKYDAASDADASDERRDEIELRFDRGTLLLIGPDRDGQDRPAGFRWDPRVERLRAPASTYRATFATLYRRAQAEGFVLRDTARRYLSLTLEERAHRTPRSYQAEAAEAWHEGGGRGVVVLPTGAGKSHVAAMIMQEVSRSTLIVVPTIDLMNQWYDNLLTTFELSDASTGKEGADPFDEDELDEPIASPAIGLLGGGYHEIRPITVTTYDSAYLHMERYGDRFGLLVFDECHHLPGETYLQAATCSIAPYRLGLTATPERQDGRHALLDDAIGPIVYRRGIKELAGEFLADYDVERVSVELTPKEREAYSEARSIYRTFVEESGVRLGGRNGWNRFIQACARSAAGRRALWAHREQRRITQSCARKLELVERLLRRHADDPVLIFTNDNDTVYTLSERFLIPSITHQTPTKERREILKRFNDGRYPVVVTSKVLNEGVDVPAARVAIVLSGSGSVREHVQRLGRILRKHGDKRALLYEVITADTVEERVSERRREHDAYR